MKAAFALASARRLARPLSAALSAALLFNSLPVYAQPAAPGTTSAPVASTGDQPLPAGGRRYSASLKQLGAGVPMVLRGVEGYNAVPFDVRADEVVSAARLHLRYTYSPALLPDLSHINVLLNGEVAATLPVPKEGAGSVKEAVVDLPPQLITQFNQLALQLIGHYTMSCEDPLHSSLWANISNQSVLDLTVAPLTLNNDLALLPLPFFDRRDARPLELPFVFAGTPDAATLEAAGAVSSWFGALASYRGARFPASFDTLPARGHAVVFATDARQGGGVNLPAPTGPTVTVLAHPSDRHSKLLVIGGRNSAELKTAAQAIVTGGKALTGSRAVISQLAQLQPRQPYDAPNWVRTDQPVKLGDLAPQADLNVSGFAPRVIDVPLRLPPDLHAWGGATVPLDLKYRYTPQQLATSSSLNVGLNDTFIKSFALPSVERLNGGEGLLARLKTDDSLPVEARIDIPLVSMPARSQLQFRYQYDYIKQGECRDVIIDNVRGAIEPDSTIDLTGLRHFIAMPDLAAFGDSGFPFTRLADLSQTAVILPDQAGPADIAAYLGVMGRLGESTGLPATAVTVAQANQAANLASKDLIVLASGDNQPLLREWASHIPSAITDGSRRFELSDLPYKAWNWLVPNPRDRVEQARNSMTFTTNGASVVFSGFESPLQAGRSVVSIAASRPESLAEAIDALIGGEDRPQRIAGSMAVVQGKQVEVLVAEQTYHVGNLGPLRTIQWTMSRHPWLVLVLGALGILLLAIPVYLALRGRARQRLQSGEHRGG